MPGLAEVVQVAGVSALTFVFGGGLGAWWLSYRKDQRDETTDEVNVIQTVATTVGTLQERLSVTFDQSLAARQEAADARLDAQAARQETASLSGELSRVRSALAYIAQHVRPLIEWIDAGAPEPVPEVSDDLRRAVALPNPQVLDPADPPAAPDGS